MRTLKIVAAGAVLALLAAACGSSGETPEASPSTSATTVAETSDPVEFNEAMRKLWEDHIAWTRLYIVSAAADAPDTEATLDRLLANQTDIGDAIKPFYGDDAGAALTELLQGHIVTAGELIAAAKAGDTDALTAANTAWYANADEIAEFLATANPDNWPADEMRSMMHEHLDATLAEAVARLEGRYADDVAAYDEVHVQIVHMADMLADGITNQFPDRFPAES